MNFNSVYDIALDILNKVGGDVTKAYDSAYSVALAILGEIGGDITKNYDSVYSIMEEIYRVRFGETLPAMDSVYSIAEKINEELGEQTTGYDSTYSILVDVSENPYLVGHEFSIITAEENTVIINGEETTSGVYPVGTSISWSVSREGYISQSGTYVMGDEDYSIEVNLIIETHTFTINPTPADAVVIINGEERTSITADYGTAITWSVSRTGYTSQTGSYLLTQDHIENVSLVINQYTFTIVPVPNDATVVINGEERSSITADYGTIINWSVSKTGYTTQSGTETLTETYSMEIDLSVSNFTFTIEATPVDAVVTINGEQRTSLTAPYGTAITWSVSKDHYVSQSGSYTLTGDHYETVDLVPVQHTFSIITDAANTVVINGVERSSITAGYGTTITWSVSREHYVTQSGTFTLTADTSETVTLVIMTFNFTINPTPADAVVTINGQVRSSLTADYGTAITWSVSRTGYVTQSDSLTLEDDTIMNIVLVAEQFTFTINPTPVDAVVTINGQVRSSLTADYGTAITWSVAKTGYVSQSGSLTLEDDTTETVSLVLEQHTFTIAATPNDATVTINGQTITSITADYGTAISWSVAKTGYVTQTGSYSLTQDHTETVTLVLEQYTFTIVPDPADAVVVINNETRTAITADYGTVITWEVSKTDYNTETGSYTLTQDHTENVTLSPAGTTITFNKGNVAVKLIVNGEYLGTDAATHEVTVAPGTTVNWEAYRAGSNAGNKSSGYATKKGTLVADVSQSVNVSLSTAKFIDGFMNYNGTAGWSIYNTAMGTYDALTMNYGTYSGGLKRVYSTESPLIQGYTYQTTFQRSGNASSMTDIRLEGIVNTISLTNGVVSMTGYTDNPDYLSLDSCRATSMTSILVGGSSTPMYVYLNNWAPSSITNLQSALGSVDNNARINARMNASTNATTPKTIADYPQRLKELHMNCWESIPTPASFVNGATSYTGSVLMIFNVVSGLSMQGGWDGNKDHVYNLMKSAEVDVYAYGWSSEDLTKLMNTFKIQSVCANYSYYNGEYDMSGAGVIRIHINDHQYYEWKLETEYPSVSSFAFNTSSPGTKCYYNCTQWTLVDTTA